MAPLGVLDGIEECLTLKGGEQRPALPNVQPLLPEGLRRSRPHFVVMPHRYRPRSPLLRAHSVGLLLG